MTGENPTERRRADEGEGDVRVKLDRLHAAGIVDGEVSVARERAIHHRDVLKDAPMAYLWFRYILLRRPEDAKARAALLSMAQHAKRSGPDPVTENRRYRDSLGYLGNFDRRAEAERELPTYERNVRAAIEHIIARGGTASRKTELEVFRDLDMVLFQQRRSDGVLEYLLDALRKG